MVCAELIVSFMKSEAAKKHSDKVAIDGVCLGNGTGGSPGYRVKNFLKCFSPVLYVLTVDGDKALLYRSNAAFARGSAPINRPKQVKSSRAP